MLFLTPISVLRKSFPLSNVLKRVTSGDSGEIEDNENGTQPQNGGSTSGNSGSQSGNGGTNVPTEPADEIDVD